MNKLNEFNSIVTEWNNILSQETFPNYDIALFKIWIAFEKTLGYFFTTLSITPSTNNKLTFIDPEHLSKFITQRGKSFIEYLDCIKRFSPHIFINNPFDIILSDQKYCTVYEQIYTLRNYIAHESGEARGKVLKTFFSNNEARFLEPNDFLKTKVKGSAKTHYTFYTESLQDIIEWIENFY